MPADDETPGRFRRRLYDRLRRKLALGHELAGIRSDEIAVSPEVFTNFESRLFEAARQEAEHPSPENLPENGLLMRTRVDGDTGEKQIIWHGRKSFIADLNRPAERSHASCIRRA